MTTSDTQNGADVLAFRSTLGALIQNKDDSAALELAEKALNDPALAIDAIGAMASVYARAGGVGYAIKLLTGLVEQQDHPADVPEILAVLYCTAGSVADALYYAKLSTTSVGPELFKGYFTEDFPKFQESFAQIASKPLLGQGLLKLAQGQLGQARFHVEQHLLVFPNDVEALDAYSQIQIREGDLQGAIAMLRSITSLGGPTATLLSRLGQCLIRTGEVREGLACHQEAASRAPNAPALLGAAVADLRYVGTAEAVASGLPQAWFAQLAATAPKTVRPAPKYAGATPVRICYLCSSLESDAQRAMMGALAKAHDRSRVSVIGFGHGESEAAGNQWSRGAFDLWRDVSSLDVTTMGALIRGEGAHVVVDADGVLAPAKAGLFQRNTAPVQVSWLNAPVGGRVPGNFLACVPGTEAGEAEIALPAGRWFLGDPLGAKPVGAPPPSAASGTVTFGAEVSLAELSPRLAMIWSRVLQAVPGSSLLLRDLGQFADQDVIARVIGMFGNAGVAHRVDVVGNTDRKAFAADLDLALMPFPHADILAYGEYLRCGVPVMVPASEGIGADLAALLRQAGLGDALIGADIAETMDKAIGLARDAGALAALRSALPERLAALPAFDAKGFARMLEDAFIQALSRIQA